mmetsp:Transcript_6068/g.10880  ORF Transcript_6068/g.10880 Transcript_6068/m.10880 type:complete len:173 (-) Transcript_6068:40-558(-)
MPLRLGALLGLQEQDAGCHAADQKAESASIFLGEAGLNRAVRPSLVSFFSSERELVADAGSLLTGPTSAKELHHSGHWAQEDSAFNATVEGQAHAAAHAEEHNLANAKALKNDTSLEAQEAKFLTIIVAPITLLTTTLAVSAAFMEAQCGRFLVRKADLVKQMTAARPAEED